MLNRVEEIKSAIEKQKALIAANDKQIEDAERRQSFRRRNAEALYRQLVSLETCLERAEAPLRKPTGPCVVETAPDGTEWRV